MPKPGSAEPGPPSTCMKPEAVHFPDEELLSNLIEAAGASLRNGREMREAGARVARLPGLGFSGSPGG